MEFIPATFDHTIPSGDDTYGRVSSYKNGDFTTLPFGASDVGKKIYVSERTHLIFRYITMKGFAGGDGEFFELLLPRKGAVYYELSNIVQHVSY